MSRRRHHDDRGSITLWTLGLCVCILILGGLTLDLWRAFTYRQQLAETADAAATAGATALDTNELRATGTLWLDPDLARQRAANLIDQSDTANLVDSATIAADSTHITVQLHGRAPLTLLRLIDSEPLSITVTASATPTRGAP